MTREAGRYWRHWFTLRVKQATLIRRIGIGVTGMYGDDGDLLIDCKHLTNARSTAVAQPRVPGRDSIQIKTHRLKGIEEAGYSCIATHID